MVASELPDETLLVQLAEECGELVQASMKVVRHDNAVSRGVNPYTQEPWVLENNLIEEMADVLVVMDAFLEAHPVMKSKVGEIRHVKEIRWYDRLNHRNDE